MAAFYSVGVSSWITATSEVALLSSMSEDESRPEASQMFVDKFGVKESNSSKMHNLL